MPNTTTKTAVLVASAIAMASTLGVVGTSGTANAAEMEKCFGISKAGKNDCAATGNPSCAGTAKRDNDPNAYIAVPKGTCDKIVGGVVREN